MPIATYIYFRYKGKASSHSQLSPRTLSLLLTEDSGIRVVIIKYQVTD